MNTGGPPPVPVGDIQAVLAPPGQGRTLPSPAYISPAVFEWEAAHLFEGSWVCAGRSAQLARPGDRTAVRVGAEGILLIRGDDGRLRGFFNTCRHRGHELVPCGEADQGRVVKCPYHGWVYGLDGRLRAAPRYPDLAEDDPVREGLVPARIAEWHGWVFVNPSGTAPEFADHAQGLDEHVAPYRPARLVAAATHNYEVATNWKVVVENYHECYHCPSIHPELCRVTPSDSGDNFEPQGLWAGGSMDLKAHAETMSLTGQSGGRPLPGLDGLRLRQVYYLGLFPNLLFSLHPDYVMTHRIEPVAPGRCRIECQWLFDPDQAASPEFDPAYAVEFWDLTNRQDWAACESVQRGVASRGYRPGPLAADEVAVHQFISMVARGYLTGSPGRPVSGVVVAG